MNSREKALDDLKNEQLDDGSFGRFHTMDTQLKRKIPTTEAAAWLMYKNGITRGDEVCDKTCLYMENLLRNLQKWPDMWEKNEWFTPAVPLFVASKLALFSSETAEYKKIRDTWISLLVSAFEQGSYSADITNKLSSKLIGVKIDSSYIGFHSLNCLALFALNTDKIPPHIQKSYLHWLHGYNGKIAYTNVEPINLEYNKKSERVISLLSEFSCFSIEFPDLACLL